MNGSEFDCRYGRLKILLQKKPPPDWKVAVVLIMVCFITKRTKDNPS